MVPRRAADPFVNPRIPDLPGLHRLQASPGGEVNGPVAGVETLPPVVTTHDGGVPAARRWTARFQRDDRVVTFERRQDQQDPAAGPGAACDLPQRVQGSGGGNEGQDIGADDEIAAPAQGRRKRLHVGPHPGAVSQATTTDGRHSQHPGRMIDPDLVAEPPAVLLEERTDAAADIQHGPPATEQAALAQPPGDDPSPVADEDVAHLSIINRREPVPVARLHRKKAEAAQRTGA